MHEESVLGYKKQDWWLLFGDVIFFYFMLLWPALKTLVVIDVKEFIGRWSAYWIGLPPFLVLYYILRLILYHLKIFPIIEIAIGLICSFKNGAFIQRFAVYVISPYYKKYYSQLRSLPKMAQNVLDKTINFVPKFLFTALLKKKEDTGPQVITDDEDDE